MLSLNIGRPKLARFITRKKDDAPCFLCITFKHKPYPLGSPGNRGSVPAFLTLETMTDKIIMQSTCHHVYGPEALARNPDRVTQRTQLQRHCEICNTLQNF